MSLADAPIFGREGGGGGGVERERERVVADKFHAAAFQKIKKKTTYHLLEY